MDSPIWQFLQDKLLWKPGMHLEPNQRCVCLFILTVLSSTPQSWDVTNFLDLAFKYGILHMFLKSASSLSSLHQSNVAQLGQNPPPSFVASLAYLLCLEFFCKGRSQMLQLSLRSWVWGVLWEPPKPLPSQQCPLGDAYEWAGPSRTLASSPPSFLGPHLV